MIELFEHEETAIIAKQDMEREGEYIVQDNLIQSTVNIILSI